MEFKERKMKSVNKSCPKNFVICPLKYIKAIPNHYVILKENLSLKGNKSIYIPLEAPHD
jgi:hypothetical protein